jgi:hypothetical protein
MFYRKNYRRTRTRAISFRTGDSPLGHRRHALEPLEDRRLLTASYMIQSMMAGGVVQRMMYEPQALVLDAAPAPAGANATGVFNIVLQKSPALLANPVASAAWDAAAELVESFFHDPVTIVIDADVSELAPGVLAQAGSSRVTVNYDQLRSMMIADAQKGENLQALLPTLAQLQVELPVDATNPFTFGGGLANRATLKALGMTEAQLPPNPSEYNPSVNADVFISFNSSYNFDYDRSDGIAPGSFDFIGIAVHEIFHGLGFVSTVDVVDFMLGNPQFERQVPIGPLDMFRMRPGAGGADFTGAPRTLAPMGDAVVYDGVYNPVGFTIPGLAQGDVPMSTGRANGDGNQASHYKTDDITGVYIGIMDPTIAPGTVGVITETDLRLMGYIGWDLIDPVQLSVHGVSALEGDSGITEFVFAVTASNSSDDPYTVDYTTIGQTATPGVDYEEVSGTLFFTPGGPLTQYVTVRVFGDLTIESNETFLLRLSNATGPASIEVAEAVGEILNDDVEVSVGDIILYEGNQGTRDAVFTVTALGSVNRNIVVTYSTLNGSAQAATDYLPRVGQVVLTPAQPWATVSVPIVGDRMNEGTESFQLVLTNVEGARLGDGVADATILDEDPLPTMYVSDAQVTTTSAGNYVAIFTVALDVVSGREVSVNYTTVDLTAIAGLDYAPQSGTLVFPSGVTSQQVAIPVTTHGIAGGNKKFTLNLTNAVNATVGDARGDGTIVFAAEPVNEYIIDNGAAGFTRSLNGWTTLTNTLAYQLDYDYAAAGNGSATATWNFTAIPNGSYEVFARWNPFSNRATNAPYTILDNQTTLGTVLVNQQLAPTGEFSNGVAWQSLGFFDVSTNTLRVRLSNNANGYVTADAIRIVGGGIPAPSAEIDVAGLDHSISTGDISPAAEDGTDFGTVPSLGVSVVRTFTITNNGNADLHLTGNPLIEIGGLHATDFTVTTLPAAVVAPGGKTTFQVTFRATDVGTRTATVTIANNDDSEHPFQFVVQGTLNNSGQQLLAHNAALPQDVTNDGRVSASDALVIINRLLTGPEAQPLASLPSGAMAPTYFFDVTADGRVNSSDLLSVVNHLLVQSSTPAAAPQAAEPLASRSLTPDAVDEAFSLFDEAAEPLAEVASRVELAAQVAATESRLPVGSVALLEAADASDLLIGEDDDQEGEPGLI